MVHNTYMLVWAEQGTIGLLLFLGMHANIFWIAIVNLRYRGLSDRIFLISIASACGVLAIMVDYLSSFFIKVQAFGRVYWIVVGLIVAAYYWNVRNEALRREAAREACRARSGINARGIAGGRRTRGIARVRRSRTPARARNSPVRAHRLFQVRQVGAGCVGHADALGEEQLADLAFHEAGRQRPYLDGGKVGVPRSRRSGPFAVRPSGSTPHARTSLRRAGTGPPSTCASACRRGCPCQAGCAHPDGIARAGCRRCNADASRFLGLARRTGRRPMDIPRTGREAMRSPPSSEGSGASHPPRPRPCARRDTRSKPEAVRGA